MSPHMNPLVSNELARLRQEDAQGTAARRALVEHVKPVRTLDFAQRVKSIRRRRAKDHSKLTGLVDPHPSRLERGYEAPDPMEL
jgi:hypothetical protein